MAQKSLSPANPKPNPFGPERKLTYEEWASLFKPTKHPNGDRMFETYGADREKVMAMDRKLVWTIIDDGGLWIRAGAHFVNRFGYLICEVPWTDTDLNTYARY